MCYLCGKECVAGGKLVFTHGNVIFRIGENKEISLNCLLDKIEQFCEKTKEMENESIIKGAQ